MNAGQRTGWCVLLAVISAAAACDRRPPAATPTIEFTVVPRAGMGGALTLAPIAGRVTGAAPGQQIVLFAKSNMWWVQPLTVQPYTPIAADATWKTSIHIGTEYAALLVAPGYRPPATTETLPKPGGGVIAVATVKGTGDYSDRAGKILSFSGYEWEVRQVPSDRGGGNEYEPANAWTDAEGLLHLKVTQREGRWTSAEVFLTRSLGYGTYQFVVRDTSQLDPAVALGLLTWDDQGADQNHRELDIEISQWGDRSIPNAQYVLQPYYVPANVARFQAPPGTLTHSFRWEPGRASFRTTRRNASPTAPPIAEHEFLSGVPTSGTERVRMNLYFFRYSPLPPQKDAEVIIERFLYLP